MSTVFELDQDGYNQRIADARLSNFDVTEDLDASASEGILTGLGEGVMRGGARAADTVLTVGRTIDPLTYLADTPEETEMLDLAQDEMRKSSINFWTPSSREVGVIGRALGGFGEMVLPLAATGGNPALLIGTAGIEGAKDMIDQGVDATTAVVSGEVDALATAIGFKLPFLGKSLVGKMVTGGVGNVLVGAGSTELQRELLSGRGYDELAQNYDPLDVQSRAIDLLSGMAFGGLDWASVRSSDRAAAAAANNAKHFQQDTAPGIPQDFAAISAHAQAMGQLEQMIMGEPVSVDPAVFSANFKARPARDFSGDEQAIREIIGDLPEPRAETPQEVARPIEPPRAEFTGEAAVRNPIDFDATPEVKLQQMKALTEHNLPLVQKLVDQLNEALPGSKSILNIKKDETILAKAQRPSIRAKKPWHDVEHIRDALRFKTILSSLDQMSDVAKAMKEHGISAEKVDTSKLLTPGPWGWRMVAVDLRMPNGQLVEFYMPLKELDAANMGEGHKIFERWRDADLTKLSPEKRAEYETDRAKSQSLYQAAWEVAALRTGLDDTAALASLKNFEASAESLTSRHSSMSEPVKGTSVRQTPSTRTAETSSDKTTTVSGDSRNLKTVAGMGDSSTGIIRAEGFESPVITALKEQLKQADIMVATGELDAEGNAVVRSGREVLAQAERDVAKAVHDSQAFEAAVTCFLTRGEE